MVPAWPIWKSKSLKFAPATVIEEEKQPLLKKKKG